MSEQDEKKLENNQLQQKPSSKEPRGKHGKSGTDGREIQPPPMESRFVELDQLIYAPLAAVSKSNLSLADNIVRLMSESGELERKNVKDILHLKHINIAYSHIKNSDDNTNILEEVAVKIPLISIIPLSNLQVSKAKVRFDVEVKASEQKEEDTLLEARVCAPARRKSNFIPKIHYNIEMESVETPEGLSRFLDSLYISHVPQRMAATPLDENGEPLTGSELEYYHRIQELKMKEKRLNAVYRNVSDQLNARKTQLNCPNLEQLIERVQAAKNTEVLPVDKRKEILEILDYMEQMDGFSQEISRVRKEYLDLEIQQLREKYL